MKLIENERIQPKVQSHIGEIFSEKMEEKITAIGTQTKGLKKKIANWAKSQGSRGTFAEQTGEMTPKGWCLAKKLVFDKVKENLGL